MTEDVGTSLISVGAEEPPPPVVYELQIKEIKVGNEAILPQSLWDQLKRLGRKPKPDLRGVSGDPESWKGTHAGDELEMAEVTQKHIAEVASFLFKDQKPGSILQKDAFPAALSLMILTGDLGKTGGCFLSPTDPEPAVARMYIDLFIDQRHADTLGVPTVGQLMSKPIDTVLTAAKKVATEFDPANATDFETRYALTSDEQSELRNLGYPPDTFPIGAFFSEAHIREGEKLLLGNPDLSPEQKKLAIIGLSHHFSQNVLPKGISEIDLSDPSIMKTIAYLEVLDKVHANIFRGKKTPDEALEATQNQVLALLQRNKSSIPQCPSNVEDIYREVISFFREKKIHESF